ncbi:hypothetical protein QBC34DRAFT_363893 [Podospora aff. communis PSN243]|uniref:Uncharacterized protein n=1 Tax=Podospora aff. communis PSN243 TaxID=3040156 RepID=A0AAV9G1A4_9PEZI|nr:hypothetical protein QBC34DRAFT_363893 [Podospora aff. communis PSN243]
MNDDRGQPYTTIAAYKTVITLRGADGHPTTQTRIQHASVTPLHGITSITEFNAQGAPVTTYAAQLVIYTDSNGVPRTTSTRRIPTSQTLITQLNAHGVPFTTFPLDLLVPRPTEPTHPIVVTQTNAQGQPTAEVTLHPKPPKQPTPSFSIPDSNTNTGLYILSHTDYYLLLFIPVLCTVIVSILAEMVSSNLHTLLPFQQMTKAGGVPAENSLLFPRGIIRGFIHAVKLAKSGDPLSLLAQGMVLVSAVITALSSEAVGIALGGSCKRDDFNGCYMQVAIFLPSARALQVLLGVDLWMVLGIVWVIWGGWESGVGMAPGSVMATGAVAQGGGLRWLFMGVGGGGERGGVEEGAVLVRLRGWRFEMGEFKDLDGGMGEYGIVPRAGSGRTSGLRAPGFGMGARAYTSFSKASSATFDAIKRAPTRLLPGGWTLGRQAKERISDCSALLFMWGLIILITYYNAIESPDTPFEHFMNEQDFGVRVLFTAFGVLLTFFWDHYYSRIISQEPYRFLSRPKGAPFSTLTTSPPTTVFIGFFSSLLRLETFPSIVAFSNILSKFIPILLSNIPFSPIQTWELHMACAWTSVASLSFISLVLVWGLLFVRYPVMPIDPASLAGQVYYLCDSEEVLGEFSGMGKMAAKECRARLETREGAEKGVRYGFGNMVGASGYKGVGVFVKEMEEKRDRRV